jgi:hypothetical protein
MWQRRSWWLQTRGAYGRPVSLDFSDQVGTILAGEPGAGKSVALANIVAHGALAFTDCRLTLPSSRCDYRELRKSTTRCSATAT